MQVGSYDPHATLHKFLTLVVIQISCMMSTWFNFLEWTLSAFITCSRVAKWGRKDFYYKPDLFAVLRNFSMRT